MTSFGHRPQSRRNGTTNARVHRRTRTLGAEGEIAIFMWRSRVTDKTFSLARVTRAGPKRDGLKEVKNTADLSKTF